MPHLELTQLNIVLSVTGAFLLLYGIVSSKIKYSLYLGEALPATIIGILLGPAVTKLVDSATWVDAETQNEITYGVSRVVIGVQLVIVGFQLPAKYQLLHWKETVFGAMPVLTTMWMATSVSIYAFIPKITWLSSLVISACVACNDSVLSQAIAKGPFADKYVPKRLRDSISSEAGANDLYQFPMLMLATFLIRTAVSPGSSQETTSASIIKGADDVGRIGGGIAEAIKMWFIETWLYTVLLSIAYGCVVGYGTSLAIKYALRRKWIDAENLFLFPTAIALFVIGTAGMVDTEDLLACFAAGNALNWNGIYQQECEDLHDGVNPTIISLTNYGGFLYFGTVIPWHHFHDLEHNGITYGRLFGLGFLIIVFRRIPVQMATYKFIPSAPWNWKEALFTSYFAPIGVSAIFFVEHTRHLFPEFGEGDKEETDLIAAIAPTVYWLVLFSIVVHGISVPILDFIYTKTGVPTIQDKENCLPLSRSPSLPRYSLSPGEKETVVMIEDRFSRNFGWGPACKSPFVGADCKSPFVGQDCKSPFVEYKKSMDVSDVKPETETKEWI